MKSYLYIFLLLLSILSCKSKTEKANADTTIVNNINEIETQKLIAEFKPIMEGVWVKTNYIQSISSSRSPYKSWKEWWGVSSMNIFFSQDGSDSVNVGHSINNHEGSEFVIYGKNGHLPTSLKINLPDYGIKSNFYELGYEKIKGEIHLVLYHYNAKGKIIDKTLYTKVANNEGTDGVEYITNKTLFAGNYKLLYGRVSSDVMFDDNGKVTGFPNATEYYIQTDFMAGPANNLDQLIFDMYTPHQKDFTFKFNGDTLNLYSMKANADSTLLMVDELKYKLVRER